MNKLMSLYRLVILISVALLLAYFDLLVLSFVTYYIIFVLAVSFFGFIIFVGTVVGIGYLLAYLLTWNSRYLEELKESFLMVFMCIISPLFLLYIVIIWDTESLSSI